MSRVRSFLIMGYVLLVHPGLIEGLLLCALYVVVQFYLILIMEYGIIINDTCNEFGKKEKSNQFKPR